MREIKVKVWDKNLKSWVNPNEVLYINPDTGELEKKQSGLTICQSTGLLDRNHSEIYEGYILRIIGALNAEVYWEFGSWQLRNQGRTGGLLSNLNDMTEIIGNIYENPELLTHNTK